MHKGIYSDVRLLRENKRWEVRKLLKLNHMASGYQGNLHMPLMSEKLFTVDLINVTFTWFSFQPLFPLGIAWMMQEHYCRQDGSAYCNVEFITSFFKKILKKFSSKHLLWELQ